jgi:thimet oligopeptidase
MLGPNPDPRELEARGAQCVERARAALAEFLELPASAPFGEVIAAFDGIRRPLNGIRGVVGLASQTHPLEPVREAALRVEQGLAAFEVELSLHRGAYERLAALDPAAARPSPGPMERRLLERALRDYRRSGVDKGEAERARIRALADELVKVGQRFDVNIASDTRSVVIEDGAAGLAGLPADYVAAHAPDERGAVTLTTRPPDLMPFMSYAERGDLRRALHGAYLNRAYPANMEVLRELLQKRHELAGLLGYPSWADYATEDKMVKSAGAARTFIEEVAARARPRMLAEYAELLEAKREDTPGADAVHGWELAYYTERVKQRRFGFDSQAVRPYFAYGNVRDGVLATSAALYGIEFHRNDALERWHPSVECYDVASGGKRIARLWLDMHPRADKYQHAAMFDAQAGLEGDVLPEAVLVCNFPEPKGSDPALLLHGQVTTFFHEFGHLLHHLFGGEQQRYLSFSGIATEGDFVEAPSQMYEEWAWDAGVLQRFARHFETGAPIPEELVARMRDAEEYGKGLHVGTQMFYARLALAYHERDPQGLDLDQTMIELKRSMTPVPYEPGTHFQASFGHLNGYSAIYYTYMWSLVIAKDLFSRFAGDLMNGNTARAYRRAILAPGGSKDAAELVRDFLGRDYALEAWESWLAR